MVKRPPSTLVRTLWICAVGLTAAMLLMPASRFGYLIYPAVLAAGALVARDAQEGTRDAHKCVFLLYNIWPSSRYVGELQ
ncbi:hypothetical protein [Lawsonella clevelandensis]|nr:hypothetical protein [Lawsonella clevelandensis]